ncbi:hypothetical protein LZU96_00825 [Pantoea agglomerans]|uniref:hypothetical protein n=1 Tax=Enterobacter agglomerans TaxID=549 RepID=UPI001F304427|nr:hypothetical protein [Pantoea agglomerans]UIL52544.1 hypothetical protein LZU96_00825 [Pantoea agglomerans]
MTISFTDIDGQAANLKKARAVLSILLETMPGTDVNEDYTWLINLAHGTVHDTIQALEAAVDAELKSPGKGVQAKS